MQRVCAQIRNAKKVDGSAGQMQCFFWGVGGIRVFIFMAQNTKLHHLDHYKWDQALQRNALYYRVCAATFKLTVPKL